MAYFKTLGAILDFSLGTCPPGFYKWHPNAPCEPAYGEALPEDRGSTSEVPFDFNVGRGNRTVDFSGGSCGAGMVRPGPAEPCQPITPGMHYLGDVDSADMLLYATYAGALLLAGLLLYALK